MQLRPRVPDTPLTNRQYLGPRDPSDEISQPDNQSAARLQALLNGRSVGPSEVLQDIFKSCETDPSERIESVVKGLSVKFCASYVQETDYANQRVQLGTKLFYKFLESILLNEQILQTDISVSP